MKIKSLVLAVALSLIFAAPAAASPSLALSVSTSTVAIDAPVSYTVSGDGAYYGEYYESYSVWISTQPGAECKRYETKGESWRLLGEGKPGTSAFSHTAPIPVTAYEHEGGYRLCAYRYLVNSNGEKCEVNHSTDSQCASASADFTAVAADTIRLGIEPATAVQGESVSYKVTGTDTKSTGEEIWAYARIPGTSKCQSVGEEENSITGHILGTEIKEPTFEYKGSVPGALYESPGTYLACAYIILAGKPTILAASSFTFVVISKLQHEEEVAAKHKAEEEAAATKRHEEEAAVTKRHEEEAAATKKREEESAAKATPPAPAPSTAPVAPVAALTSLTETPPLVQPLTSAQRLAKAVAKCKKRYKHNKKKRVVCEKQAKKKYGPKPKRH
ncbi:MAG: hypothetical protein ABSG95_09415 [Solirubrobacteraceae bacterium]|jgi:hypothetical protein